VSTPGVSPRCRPLVHPTAAVRNGDHRRRRVLAATAAWETADGAAHAPRGSETATVSVESSDGRIRRPVRRVSRHRVPRHGARR